VGRHVLVAVVRDHLHDPVGDRHEPGVVGRHDDDPAGVAQVAQQPDHRLRLDVVEVRRRLVGEEQGRILAEPAGHGHPLLLAPGELAGVVVGAVGQADEREELVRAPERVGA
jgi:hypothetical protein